ncbi:hypothetical protein BHM03_00011619 [Ensete ventricosum]|nr:hypothetical protein BHM03_00011619 [Ensete ventricosum]
MPLVSAILHDSVLALPSFGAPKATGRRRGGGEREREDPVIGRSYFRFHCPVIRKSSLSYISPWPLDGAVIRSIEG